MRIIQLIQKPQRRGAEIFASQLSEGLINSGHQVLLISLFRCNSDLAYNGEFIQLDRPLKIRLFDYKGWKTLAYIIKDFQPDIIQANAADTLKFSVLSKLLFSWKPPIIYRNANQMGDFLRGQLHIQFNQFLLSRVKGVVSVSAASEKDFFKHFKFDEANATTIPIGLDFHHIEKDLVENLSNINFPNTSYLLMMSSLVPEKNHIRMVHMFENVINAYPEIKLVFLGSGPIESEIKEQVNMLNLANNVIFLGSQANVFPILKRAKALLMPSKIEGLPGAILEAMYLKIPVIAYKVGGIGEVLEDKINGFLIEKDDENAFISAIKSLLSYNNIQVEAITSDAFQKVNIEFDNRAIVKQFEAYYRFIIQSKDKSKPLFIDDKKN